MKNPFRNKKKPVKKVEDTELQNVRRLIDDVLYPKINKDLLILNDYLKEQKIQVGMDITWIFQKIE